MNVGSGLVGKVIKALWYLGGEDMEMDIVENAIAHLRDADWIKLYAVWHYMPHWMTDRILWLESDRVQSWLFARKNPASQK